MKTVACDICGRKKEDLYRHFGGKLFRFKQSFWNSSAPAKDFDICPVCLETIREKSRRERSCNTCKHSNKIDGCVYDEQCNVIYSIEGEQKTATHWKLKGGGSDE